MKHYEQDRFSDSKIDAMGPIGYHQFSNFVERRKPRLVTVYRLYNKTNMTKHGFLYGMLQNLEEGILHELPGLFPDYYDGTFVTVAYKADEIYHFEHNNQHWFLLYFSFIKQVKIVYASFK